MARLPREEEVEEARRGRMSTDGRFVARILEASAGGYAGSAATLLAERHPRVVERHDPGGFASWKAQFQRWALDLSAAIEVEAPELFVARILWSRRTFLARDLGDGHLEASVETFRDMLAERLPADSARPALDTVDRALVALRAAEEHEEETGTDDKDVPMAALSYLATILEGRPRKAIEQLRGRVEAGVPVTECYLQTLIPAQREAGRMWQLGELSIAEEHVITTTTQRAMAVLAELGRRETPNDRTVLLACVAGNNHDLGIRAIADFFEIAGWNAIHLGPDVPPDEIARSVQIFSADVAVLAATLDTHLKPAARTIERIRAIEDRTVKVIVGGPVFDTASRVWRTIGADGHAARIEEAEPLAARLVES